jgi:2-dehydro-3-deoxygalactonokinase
MDDYLTSMPRDIFYRLTTQGLLASIVEGQSADGHAFQSGANAGYERKLRVGTLLFGARARVIRGQLKRSEASSYIRGMMIGADIADAIPAYPALVGSYVHLIGNGRLSHLYASALARIGASTRLTESREARFSGFQAHHSVRIS